MAHVHAPNDAAHWDKMANHFNEKNEKTIDRLIHELRSRKDWIGVDWIEDGGDVEDVESELPDDDLKKEQADQGGLKREVKLLDYACGPGMCSRALSPFTSSVVGIDVSSVMVNLYNTAASNQGLLPSEMRAVEGNLLNPSDPSPPHLEGEEFFGFDIAIVSFAFHHFDDPAFASKQLAKRLKKGGVLLVMDFVSHGDDWSQGAHSHGHDHGHEHGHGHGHGHGHEHHAAPTKDDKEITEIEEEVRATVMHNGFDESAIKGYFEDAGLGGSWGYQVLEKEAVFKFQERTITRIVFLAKGTKV